jgi:hypothetical protein
MKGPVYIEGTVEEVSDKGAVIKLSDGRTGFVSSGDYFFEEYTDKADTGPGDQVMVRELGPGSDGELLLGLQPIDCDNRDRVGIEVEWVTPLEEVRGACPDEVAAVERHPLFVDPYDPDCTGWMWIALLAAKESSCREYQGTTKEDKKAEAELLDLYKALCRKFKDKTKLGLSLEILYPENCDRIPTLPLAGSEGSYACGDRCCVFALDGMQTLTKAGKKFDKKSECRAWSQY